MEPEKSQQCNIQVIQGPTAWCGQEQVDGNSDTEPGPPIQTDSELQASLHSRKEQARRLQIRTCCQRLHNLLPFVNGRLDAATTLELTAKYMGYLKQKLPKDMLAKVDKALGKNRKVTWRRKPSKAPKKCRTSRLQEKKTEPITKITSHVRMAGQALDTHGHVEVNQLACEADPTAIALTHPSMRNIMVPTPFVNHTLLPSAPLLLDKSTVPHGQMLPVRQNQSAAQLCRSMEHNWMLSPPGFLPPDAGLTFPSEMSACPATTPVLPSVDPGMESPFLSPVLSEIFDQVSITPDLSWFMNWTSPGVFLENQTLQPPVSPNETCPPADALSDCPLVPPAQFEDGDDFSFSTAWPVHPAPNDLRDLHLPTKLELILTQE